MHLTATAFSLVLCSVLIMQSSVQPHIFVSTGDTEPSAESAGDIVHNEQELLAEVSRRVARQRVVVEQLRSSGGETSAETRLATRELRAMVDYQGRLEEALGRRPAQPRSRPKRLRSSSLLPVVTRSVDWLQDVATAELAVELIREFAPH